MSKRAPRIAIARAYDPGVSGREYRVLVDRLWPRGVARDALALDAWPKDLAPSAELRRWFGHRPERWDEFRERYRRELETKGEDIAALAAVAADRPLLLIFGARDELRNNAVVLRDALLQELTR
jgi:uncharacterized protein YeaO (DUF488 family)